MMLRRMRIIGLTGHAVMTVLAICLFRYALAMMIRFAMKHHGRSHALQWHRKQ
jgi:hypothetical protein